MSRGDPIQNSFVSGLLSSRLRGRDDLKQYVQGMRQALNGICTPHGGFTKRPGTHFVAEVKNTTSPLALLPFEVAVEQQYVIEAGHQYFRFYANQGVVETFVGSGVPYEVVTNYTGENMRNLRYAQNADIMYLVHKDGHPYKLSRTAFATFAWTKVAFKDGQMPRAPQNITATTLTVSGVGPYTLTWSANPVTGGLTTAADVGRGVLQNHAGTNLAWYLITAVTSATTATATLMKGAHDGTARTTWSLGLFSDTEGPRCACFHENRLWYGGSLRHPDYIVGSVSDDFDNFDPGNGETADRAISKRVVGSQVNTILWLQSQSNQLAIGTSGGEYRLFGANDDILTPTSTVVRPSSNIGSAAVGSVLINNKVLYVRRDTRSVHSYSYDLSQDSYRSENLTLLAEDLFDRGGITRMTYQGGPNSIVWLVRGDGLLVGLTYEPEQEVIAHHPHNLGGTVLDVVSIKNLNATADQLWALVEYVVGGALRQYIVYMVDQFRPDYDHSRATAIERSKSLDDAFYVDCGLSLDDPKTITSISMANPVVITSTAHGFNNGERVKIRVPRIVPVDTKDDRVTDWNGSKLDNLSAVVANATANTFELSGVNGTGYSAYVESGTARKEVTGISGLGHLKGRQVALLVDGATHPRRTVSATGTIDLQGRGSIVHVGLPYTYRGETQRFAGGGAGGRVGTEQGKRSKIKRVALILHDTMGVFVGTGGGTDLELEEVQFRDGQTFMDRPPPLFSGEVEVPVENGWSRGEATVYFESVDPHPVTVLAVAPRVETNERG